MPNNVDETTPNNSESDVRREKALVHSGGKSRPGTGSLHPVAIGAVVEATKPLKPSVKRVALATWQACRP